jgi:iron complex outermembrane receptor protein
MPPCRLIALFALCAAAPAETLRLRVVDSQGGAIAGAVVTVEGRRLVTDAAGEVRADVAPPVTVQASAPGFQSTARRLESWDSRGVEIVLHPAPVYSAIQVVVGGEPLGPSPVTSSAVEIERGTARTVFDAIDKLIPGVFVTRRAVMGYGIASGGTGSVSIHGVGNSPNTGVLVVIDGRPDFMGLMGHPLPDFYSLADAASVSVTQGPASVLYGSNAMGGVIEIQPAEPSQGVHTELTGSLGSYATGQHRLRHGAAWPRSFYHLTAGVDHTNGHRPVSHFRNQDGAAAAGYTLSDTWRASLRGRYGHFVVEDPGPVTGRPGYWASVGRGGFSANLDNAAGRSWGSARVYSSWGHHHIADGWRSNDRTTGLRVHQHVLASPQIETDVGTDVVNYGGLGRNRLTGIDYGSHGETSAAGFGRLRWTPLNALRLNAGVRYEHSTIFGGITVPEVGAALAWRPGYSLHLAVARGFRNPTIRELYLFPAPNPELRPEHIWNYQAAVAMQPAKNLAASLTGYYAKLDNLVVVTGRFPNLQLLNSGVAINRGIDATLRWRAGRHLSFFGGYAWLRSTNLAPYLPEHKATYAADFALGRASLVLHGVTVGQRWADAAKMRRLGGYTAPGLKLMIPFGNRWTVFAMVDNFIDERYEVVTGYPMPGINAAGGFSLRL